MRNTLISIGLLVITLFPVYRFCLIDSDRPDERPAPIKILVALALPVTLGTWAAQLFLLGASFAIFVSSAFIGSLYVAAWWDPTRIPTGTICTTKQRLQGWIKLRIKKLVFAKFFSLTVVIISNITFPQYWNYVALLLALHLLYFRMASCICMEAKVENPFQAPAHVRQKWHEIAVPAAFSLCLVLGGPFFAISHYGYVPNKWSQFGGLGLGGFIEIFVESIVLW